MRAYTRKKWLSVLSVCLLVTAGLLGFITFESNVVSAGTTWHVGSGPENDTAFIGYAIAILANPGDTVFVHSGVYGENVWINKTLTLIGEDRNTTVIDGGGSGIVVDVYYTDWVNITGFTITNGNIGVRTRYSSNNSYKDNIVRGQIKSGGVGGYGFFFSGTPYSNNKIIGNIVYNNDHSGIYLEDQTGPDNIVFWNNSIINNTVYNNNNDGISICAEGTNNFIVGNVVHHNGLGSINPRSGIRLSSASNGFVMGNTVYSNNNGIYLEGSLFNIYSPNNTIAGNMVYNNDNAGIRISDAQYNTFIDNSIFNNDYNVYMISLIDPNLCNDNNFININLSDAAINNIYMKNSGRNTFINCTLTNTSINVYMDQQSRNNNFINCSLKNATQDDFNITDDSHAILLNTTFNKTSVYYGDTLSSLTVKWFMHVHVIYYNGTPASYAEVWINDTSGSGVPLLYGPADSQGWIRWFVVTEYIEQDMVGDHMGNGLYFTPHNVTATDGSLWGYAEPFMDISKVVLIILGVPTELPPPTNLTTKTVNNDNNVELEWDPPSSPALDHYLIYRADSATGFDFSAPYNISTTWPDPLNTTWVDPDPGVTAVDADFYYIVRATNFDESEISSTSATAGVWTRIFEPSTSTFSLPLEPFAKKDTEYYCQDMNASYIKWMNRTTLTWTQHDIGESGNNTIIEVGEGYEIGFDGQTRYTFCGLPGAMIIYDDNILFSGFDPDSEAENLTVTVESDGNVTLSWQEPASMGPGDWYEVYCSNARDGFFKTFGLDYDLACPPIGFGTNTTTITGLGANDPSARLYFMVVPFNSLGVRGASTYSIGIWTEEYLAGYDTFGIPLKLNYSQTADWYCDNMPGTVGINYYLSSENRWVWHSTVMPQDAYDPVLVMGEGYQISTSNTTKFTFIGI